MGLPDDHEGAVRVVEMVGVDSNMCCGTHVSNLSHLQAVKLLHTESKQDLKLLYFVSGQQGVQTCWRSAIKFLVTL